MDNTIKCTECGIEINLQDLIIKEDNDFIFLTYNEGCTSIGHLIKRSTYNKHITK